MGGRNVTDLLEEDSIRDFHPVIERRGRVNLVGLELLGRVAINLSIHTPLGGSARGHCSVFRSLPACTTGSFFAPAKLLCFRLVFVGGEGTGGGVRRGKRVFAKSERTESQDYGVGVDKAQKPEC